MFVIFTGNDEVLVTTKKREKKFRKVYGVDRKLDEDYDREERKDVGFAVTPRLYLD